MTDTSAIVVTGTSRGIGSAIARALAEAGFSVACLSRKGKGVEDVATEGEAAERLHAYAADVTDLASIKDALARVQADFGGIRGLVNNAGIQKDGPSAEFSTEDFMEVLGTNVMSAFQVSREAYPYLRERDSSLIVNIGSFYDRLGVPLNTAYCASKAAVGAITRCLAVEWAREHIRVLNVAPGFIATDLNREYLEQERFQKYLRRRVPVGRPGAAEEIGAVVRSLFTTEIGFLTGETIYVDGAQGING
ncbi:SDR family NAD(P)-dependent oxidoreductase [Halomonas sp. HK25]|uniref:SDR family NAD(P)-dependent oxidoreductase n=1 Tax=Halomonas sp. HK25 TaxID=3394321 RepID=UPI0039FC7081